MFKKIFGSLSKDIGIDLGTANTLVYVKDKGIVTDEPSVVAINVRTEQILAIGKDAKMMMGKTPAYIQVTRPLVGGIISDFEVTEKMLRYFIDKIHKDSFTFMPRPRVVIGVPLDITEVERKAVEDAVRSAGAREVHIVEEPMAAAIGARLPINEAIASLVVDIGGGTTDIAVISLSGVVTWKSIKIAGDELNKNIIQYAREVFNLLIGESHAEEVKNKIGSAADTEDEDLEFPLRGRDLITGLPREIYITSSQAHEAMQRSIATIIDHIKSVLEITPPELMADIHERGIVLTGGGALLRGLDKTIALATEIPVRVADDPLTCVVRGAGFLLESPELLHTIELQTSR
ncbi:MAG: rod shape-determining protein [Candidatus Magasanikbacteria bacterium]|nr:rod shape-determining protein [Candidatus Magasanikbacteria bacterium]